MKTLIPQKAPDLLARLVNDEYGYAVNCSFPNSFRLLTRSQYEILMAINGSDDLEALADRLGLASEILERFLSLLHKTDMVRYDGMFAAVKKPTAPKSLNFWIHTTNACNLGCSYCYISTLNTGKGMQDTVRMQLLYKLLEAVRFKGIRNIKLRLAGGEPMGQFQAWKSYIPNAITMLADAGCKLDFAFITNLTILNDEIIRFSKENGIAYGISLDGVGNIHDDVRKFRSGNGSFDLVDKNLRQLLDSGIAVTVNTVITNQNLAGLPDLTRYLIELDVPFRYSIVQGEPIDGELLNTNLGEAHRVMSEAIEDGWQFVKRYQFCDLKPNELGFQTCTSGFSGGAIYIDGSLKYCHVHFGDDSHSENSIFSKEFNLVDMIQNGEHLEDNKSEDCKSCRYRAVCTSGCPVYRNDGKDPHCSLYHRFIPQYYALQAKERLSLMRRYEIISQ